VPTSTKSGDPSTATEENLNPASAFLRDVGTADWPAILELANGSVAHLPSAGPQDEWLRNRRHFDSASGTQRHYVAEHPETGALLGYGAVESSPEFRLFVVTLPEHLPTVGELLYERALALLGESNAARVWFTEYASDRILLSFARAHGFGDARSFTLPDGAEATTLVKQLSGGDGRVTG
jgi:hypothetical protein